MCLRESWSVHPLWKFSSFVWLKDASSAISTCLLSATSQSSKVGKWNERNLLNIYLSMEILKNENIWQMKQLSLEFLLQPYVQQHNIQTAFSELNLSFYNYTTKLATHSLNNVRFVPVGETTQTLETLLEKIGLLIRNKALINKIQNQSCGSCQ